MSGCTMGCRWEARAWAAVGGDGGKGALKVVRALRVGCELELFRNH